MIPEETKQWLKSHNCDLHECTWVEILEALRVGGKGCPLAEEFVTMRMLERLDSSE